MCYGSHQLDVFSGMLGDGTPPLHSTLPTLHSGTRTHTHTQPLAVLVAQKAPISVLMTRKP